MSNIKMSEHQTMFEFDNGIKLSVVNGLGTYSENHMRGLGMDALLDTTEQVEIAAWQNRDEAWLFDGDVIGWVSVQDLPKIMTWLSSRENGFNRTTVTLEEMLA